MAEEELTIKNNVNLGSIISCDGGYPEGGTKGIANIYNRVNNLGEYKVSVGCTQIAPGDNCNIRLQNAAAYNFCAFLNPHSKRIS